MTTEELDRAIDETLPAGCGGCGRSLPQPGVQCQACQTWPDITREEQAAALSAPGELTLHRADAAEQRARELMQAFVAAAAVPDRLRKQAEIEQRQAEVQEAFEAFSAEYAEATRRLAETVAAEAEAKIPLDETTRIHQAAKADLERALRTLKSRKDEHQARIAVAQALPMLDRDQRLYDEARARTASARLDVENAEINIAMAEQARDEQAARLLHIEAVPPSARRLALMAHPFVAYMAELVEDRNSGHPRRDDEWANALGLLYPLAGAAGLLAMAEEGATPRVLEELTGPMSRAEDVAALRRSLGGSRALLPPGPGEASVTVVRNTIT
jgi:hypothetical protein